MAIEITIPRLGWSMEEGTFVEWLKPDGAVIAAGEPLYALEGEKALQEIESFDAGILHIPSNGPQPGDVVQVGTVIAFLLAEKEKPPELKASAAKTPVAKSEVRAAGETPPEFTEAVAAAPSVRRLARELGVDLRTLKTTGSISANDVRRAASGGGEPISSRPRVSPQQIPARNADPSQPRISPRAARTATAQGIDWTQIRGTGGNGRIRERDVLNAVRNGSSRSDAEPLPDIPGTLQPASLLRRTIARRLQASARDTVPVTLTTKIDAEALVAFRERLKSESPAAVPSYNDIIVRGVASLLKECPELNACWLNDGVYVYREMNIAFAVDTEAGLLAPVVRNADALSLTELAVQSKELSRLAREGRLTQSQLSGGTFTVTNLGMYGIDAFTPVISPQQSAILGIGRIVDEPVIRDGMIVHGKTLTLSLTFDHRVLDGAPAARWLQELARRLQQPASVAA